MKRPNYKTSIRCHALDKEGHPDGDRILLFEGSLVECTSWIKMMVPERYEILSRTNRTITDIEIHMYPQRVRDLYTEESPVVRG